MVNNNPLKTVLARVRAWFETEREHGVEVRPLAWDDAAALRAAAARGPYDLIVGGDLLYRLQVVEPLLGALDVLMTAGRTVVLLAASMQHSPETLRAFVTRAAERGYGVEQLGAEAHAEEFQSEEVRIFRLTRPKRGGGRQKRPRPEKST